MKALSILLLLSALPVLAAEPFTGTWKLDMATAKFSQKPFKFELKDGTYRCPSCDPPITVKADGMDQAVTGVPGIDTVSARIVDDRTVEVTDKKAGKVTGHLKLTTSADGKSVTGEFTDYPQSSDKPVTGTYTMKRAGAALAGMHAISGSWVMDKAENVSENALFATFEQTADGLKMTQATGEHYDAKLDGKEYPYGGSRGTDKVVLKRIGARGIEETDKLGAKVVATTQMTVSADGRTITMVVHEHTGEVSTFVFNKQ